ncbi:flagellar motor switch protein FliN [Burkholderia sp. JSH-S8]|nr:flagellar motor switch protein FliN [Burkholderia sp. JSH-S8]
MTHHATSRLPAVMRVELPEQTPGEPDAERPAAHPGLDLVHDVAVSLDIHLGSSALSVGDLMALQPGSVVTLDRRIDDCVEVRLNGRTVARAEIVAVDDQFGIRIVDIVQER